MRFVSEAEAQDLTQEVFIKVNLKIHTYRGESHIKTWIYRIALNVLKDHLKSKSHKAVNKQVPISESELEDYDNHANNSTDPEEEIDTRLMNECISEFIHRLPLNYSSVLAMRELNGLSINEISDILGLSTSTVKVRLHRAKAKLHKELLSGCKITGTNDCRITCERK
jgi:RNA polymerase sigma-70 factor (ECF subfamily)